MLPSGCVSFGCRLRIGCMLACSSAPSTFTMQHAAHMCLQEVIGAVETVYGRRKRLTRALANNQTVIDEVEIALGVVLLLLLVFIAAAIFDPGTVQACPTPT